ncbi:YihY/virulence factor BrkB family protein [Mastigocoleus sp. MO_188.B34]|uniref:YihY/virulence factor BrkB family protein n=1 Tax=Mastigocoleus sp. MO_188.B34 TaxID=3036635 RepID=UPI0026094FC7|nr:YihY/virulence factor BrkB family protein [Mastigocoleus sp. MO_188.B34]MDJ0694610.1 YihY/virulence factor BrkB family protein [Mastigocoleus sp. MO_188.B34]
MRIRTVFNLTKTTFTHWKEDNASRIAAALAFYTSFSLAPVLVIVIAIVGLVFGQQAAQGRIIDELQGLVGKEAASVIQLMIQNTQDSGSGIVATITSLALLLFGASGFFNQLQDALNTIWRVKPKPNRGVIAIIKDRFLSLLMVMGVGFLLLVSLVISAVLTAVGNIFDSLLQDFIFLWQLLNFLISFGVVTLLFAMIYKILPDVKIAWSDVWIGAVITSVLFALGKSIISIYIGNTSVGSTYGAAGSLVVMLLWIYYSAQILLFGAEFTQVYANRYGSRIIPSDSAIDLDDSEQSYPKQNIQNSSGKKVYRYKNRYK